MIMQKFTLQAKVRGENSTPSKLKAEGMVPVELYGNKVENLHLSVVRGELERIFKQAGATSIVEVQIEGVGVRPVLLHELQRHYLTEELIHADFYQVNLSEKIHANIPLEFTGESKAVSQMAGVLMELMREVEVEALPQNLPHSIVVDISGLNTFDDVVTVADIKAPEGVTVVTPEDEAVVRVQEPRSLDDLAEPVAQVDAAAVAVEKKGKEETEEEKK